VAARKGRLFLIPNLLDPASLPEAVLPASVIARIRLLRRFVVEGEKAAWRLLSRILDAEAASAVTMDRLDEHTPADALPALLAPLVAGEDMGLVSEAGMPCVADPGGAFTFANPDFSWRALNSNLVLRWEYKTGSTVYVIWSQNRTNADLFGDFSAGSEYRRLFGTHPDNTILVKFNYWFSL